MWIAAAVEGKIKTWTLSEQQNGFLFKQALSDVQQVMGKISLARRMMRQLVKSISLFTEKVRTTKAGKGTVVVNLEALLLCHDRQFVQQAYRALLGRQTDPAGLDYYTGLLRTGISKKRILAGLRLSTEGKAFAANIPGLYTAIQIYQWSKIPLLGKLILWACSEDDSPSERVLRALENKLYRLSESEVFGYTRIESVLNDLQQLRAPRTVNATQSEASETQVKPEAMQSEVTDDVLAQPFEAEVPKCLTHQAGEIYLQLKKSTSTTSRNLALAKAASDVRNQVQTQIHTLSHLSPQARDVYIQLKKAAFIHARRSA
jgi:hypothetical protein